MAVGRTHSRGSYSERGPTPALQITLGPPSGASPPQHPPTQQGSPGGSCRPPVHATGGPAGAGGKETPARQLRPGELGEGPSRAEPPSPATAGTRSGPVITAVFTEAQVCAQTQQRVTRPSWEGNPERLSSVSKLPFKCIPPDLGRGWAAWRTASGSTAQPLPYSAPTGQPTPSGASPGIYFQLLGTKVRTNTEKILYSTKVL